MRKIASLFFLMIFCQTVFSQDGFQFDKADRKKITIPFKLINNLILIPVYVNGVELNFLLDTGVEETILFSLEDKGDVKFYNVEKIKLKGLGGAEAIEGLKSSNNVLTSHGLTDKKHDVYIVLDQTFNFSSQIGIPVNGIIGYHFFRNHLIGVDYDKKKIIVYNERKNLKKVTSGFSAFDISIEKNKPYTSVSVSIKKDTIPAKLLVDLGSSDSVWLFAGKSDSIQVPENNFEDFLGRGFSGDIYGKRARIANFNFHSFNFSNPLAAFPDQNSIKNINMVDNRVGSIGGEILKRFSIIFDYSNGKMYLRKNKNYDQPFHFNMSGLEIQHGGMTWVKEKVRLNTEKSSSGVAIIDYSSESMFNYKFNLKPIYEVMSVRKDSPAEACGLMKGDVITAVNGIASFRYSLQEISAKLKSEEGKMIFFEIERNGIPMKFKFRLKSLL